MLMVSVSRGRVMDRGSLRLTGGSFDRRIRPRLRGLGMLGVESGCGGLYAVDMATKMQRQQARRRAREVKIAEQKKLEEQLRIKSDAREEVFVRLAQVDEVHAAAGGALQALIDSGDSKDELGEIFGLSKAGIDGYLRAARDAEQAVVDGDELDEEDAGSEGVESVATDSESDASERGTGGDGYGTGAA